jgi:hypothetical protein
MVPMFQSKAVIEIAEQCVSLRARWIFPTIGNPAGCFFQ